MVTKKCPVCGCTELVPYQFAEYVISEFRPFMDAFMCADCGRIEFYAPEDRRKKCVETTRAKNAEEKEKAAQIELLESQLAELNAELERCKAIANDENQTVKAVREAEASIQELSEKIRSVQDQLSQLKSRNTSFFGAIIHH